LNSGLQRLSYLLVEFSQNITQDSIGTFNRKAGELLRLLACILQPVRQSYLSSPSVYPQRQHEFTEHLQSCFNDLREVVLRQADPKSSAPSLKVYETVVILARLLQFDLGFRGIWTEAFSQSAKVLCSSIVELIGVCYITCIHYCTTKRLIQVLAGYADDDRAFEVIPILIDTLYIVLAGNVSHSIYWCILSTYDHTRGTKIERWKHRIYVEQ
jgi:hypothetical protein